MTAEPVHRWHHPVVQVFELDRVKQIYNLSGVYHDRLTLSRPFAIEIDLTAIDQL